ncbi:hypothetical protein SOVF_202050, partial [Spinacia oleracea]
MVMDKDQRKEALDQLLLKLSYWKQLAKGKWHAFGDTNMPFFYRSVKARKSKNEIRMLQINDEEWTADNDQVKDVLIKHFKELFRANEDATSSLTPPDIDDSAIVRLSDSHIHQLQRDIDEQEIKQAIFQMGVEIMAMQQSFEKRAMEAASIRNLPWCKEKAKSGNSSNLLRVEKVCIKGAYNSNDAIVMVDGAWKKVRKKSYAMSAVGWNICIQGRDIESGGMRVQALSAEQTEAKVVLQGVRKAIAINLPSILILTYCSNVVKALQDFPSCKLELTSICSEIIWLANAFVNCTIVKCSRDNIRKAHTLAVWLLKLGSVGS